MKYKLVYSTDFKTDLIKLIADTEFILASNSPRRAEILSMLEVEYKKLVPEVDESIDNYSTPSDFAEKLSVKKALAVESKAGSVIIAADTIVVLKDKIIGKPANRQEAHNILTALSGEQHIVITAISLLDQKTKTLKTGHSKSPVRFFKLGDMRIDEYIKSQEPYGKAGAYAIQGLGGELVQEYSGDLDNIIGFPARLFYDLCSGLLSEV